MSVLDLDAYVTRSRALVDSTPPSTRRETRTWLVDPLLETLGWDVHADSCLTDTIVDGTRLEYVCSVDGVPAMLVAVDPFGDSLEKSRAVALLETMAWTGIDRAIYTDGRDYLLLAGTTDVERLACRLSSLSDHESAIAHYTHDAVGRSLERHSREFVARQLAIERSNLAEAIVDELTDATEQGEAYASEFESAADRFLEQLVASFADGGSGGAVAELDSAGSDDVSVEFSDPSASGAKPDGSTGERSTSLGEGYIQRDRTDESTSSGEADEARTDGTDSRAADATESDSVADAGASTESEPTDSDVAHSSDDTDDKTESEGDGEYVVRFFNDRGSVGAIGHSSADQALVATAEYLFQRGLSGVTVPWHPDEDEDERAVLHESPTHPDGTPMSEPQQLSNGLYLETAGDTDERAARVDALVARAGLRAMLTGDWEE
ncbi:hypothetical protein [Natronorubrum tibetense]|uniref:Type I restriction enzyme R protein N-terminal domain-containing protein n=1 Tax=Natronorubrum tibetense GA33 TaxID=1114856 RepID=L9W1H0_9EURY|nr:hypothetical protein [Natronorubrum tibetense]ELY42158.1 hypothetical protein C496_07163 [Natronorubrum tibetense GA33]